MSSKVPQPLPVEEEESQEPSSERGRRGERQNAPTKMNNIGWRQKQKMKRYQRSMTTFSIGAQKQQVRFTSASPLVRFHSSAIGLQDVATSPKKLSRPHAAPVRRIRVPILGIPLRRGRIHVLRRDQTVVSTHHEAKLWVYNHTTILPARGHHEDHASDLGRYRTHNVSKEGLFPTHFDAALTFQVGAVEEDVQKFLTRDTVGHEL
mmetsp:Transcript_15751/g.42947  ORF Transcript_15751/g.42947 Transcript_15751/m.42947 type:complete len:206 (+) Transcript_15751:107-724(+)